MCVCAHTCVVERTGREKERGENAPCVKALVNECECDRERKKVSFVCECINA